MTIDKTLILVPHEDDEINLAGVLIKQVIELGREVHIAFYTNGDYGDKASVRKAEAIKSCGILGIREENIHFMGYHDCPKENEEHPFYDNAIHTQSVNDIIKLIVSIKPDLFIVNGNDKHADHKALYSLAMEALQNNNVIHRVPAVWIGFCYETGWYGVKDYSSRNLPSTLRLSDELLASHNLRWEDRIRIPLSRGCRSSLIMKNPLYRALRCHGSQWGMSKYFSVINSDQVFWPINNKLADIDNYSADNCLENIDYIKLTVNGDYVYDYYCDGGVLEVSVEAFSYRVGRINIDLSKLNIESDFAYEIDNGVIRINMDNSLSVSQDEDSDYSVAAQKGNNSVESVLTAGNSKDRINGNVAIRKGLITCSLNAGSGEQSIMHTDEIRIIRNNPLIDAGFRVIDAINRVTWEVDKKVNLLDMKLSGKKK